MAKHSADIMEDELLGQLEELKIDPQKTIKKASQRSIKEATPIYFQSEAFYLIALVILGLVVVLAVVFSFVYSNRTVPDYIVAMGSAAIGAIVGLFAPSPVKK